MCFLCSEIDRHVGLVVYNRNKLKCVFFANNILCMFWVDGTELFPKSGYT